MFLASAGRRPDAADLITEIIADAEASGFILEPAQAAAAARLCQLGESISVRRKGLLRRRTPRSVYLHGPVGRGKSWLMDSFYRQLPGRKRRIHFHDFFRQLHRGVHASAGRPEADGTAIQRSVDALLSGVDILCFDEFHVHDVGDGMFIAKLLRTAAQRRVPLVVTSNYPPDKLLPNPLWHDHFVPTIGVIKEMMDIMEIDGDTDFRRSPVAGSAAPRPSDSPGLEAFSRGKIITPGTPAQLGAFGLFPPAKSQERILTPTTQRLTVKAADDMLWVSFTELCGGLMSTADYLALAEDYGTWVIDGVPSPTIESAAGSAPAWQRFSNVVDVLYDQGITLFLVGHGPLDWDLAQDPAHRTSTQPVDLARIASRLSLLDRVEASTPFEEVEAGGS